MPEEDTVDEDGDAGEDRASADDPGLLARLEELDTEQWAEPIVTGAVAYVFGYLVTAVLFFLGPASFGSGLTLREKLGAVGITYNAGHNIRVAASHPVLAVVEGQGTFLGDTFTLFELTDLLSAEQGLPKSLYFALPAVVLVSIGFIRAWQLAPTEDIWGPVKTTLGLPVGYGAVAYLGSFLFSYPLGTDEFPVIAGISILRDSGGYTFVEQDNTTRIIGQSETIAEIQGTLQDPSIVTISPDGTSALLLGLAYPVVFASLGALAAVSLRQYRTEESVADNDADE